MPRVLFSSMVKTSQPLSRLTHWSRVRTEYKQVRKALNLSELKYKNPQLYAVI